MAAISDLLREHLRTGHNIESGPADSLVLLSLIHELDHGHGRTGDVDDYEHPYLYEK